MKQITMQSLYLLMPISWIASRHGILLKWWCFDGDLQHHWKSISWHHWENFQNWSGLICMKNKLYFYIIDWKKWINLPIGLPISLILRMLKGLRSLLVLHNIKAFFSKSAFSSSGSRFKARESITSHSGTSTVPSRKEFSRSLNFFCSSPCCRITASRVTTVLNWRYKFLPRASWGFSTPS